MVRVDKKQSAWQIFWKVLIGVVCIAVLALFIKGFIDSGDKGFNWGETFKKALGGGLSGAAAMVLQVLTLMPLRTIMNYQYRFGTGTKEAAKTLYADGGYRRYYSGLGAALIQGPVSRFGDTAANAGALAFLSSNPYTRKLPITIQSAFGSLMAALFRILLTPVDTVKTTMQTQGREGLGILRRRIKANGIGSMWYGALATAAATFVGHFPWFGTYNFLQDHLPEADGIAQTLLRQAFIGFCASVISDSVSNSLRVVKTYRQVNETEISYAKAARTIIATEGIRGLLGRGLKTRILTNGLQGLMFSILWKLFMDLYVRSDLSTSASTSRSGGRGGEL